jgi:hypothetical protein
MFSVSVGEYSLSGVIAGILNAVRGAECLCRLFEVALTSAQGCYYHQRPVLVLGFDGGAVHKGIVALVLTHCGGACKQ